MPEGLSGVHAFAAGVRQSLALKTDGTVVAWGIAGDHGAGEIWGQTQVPAGLTGVQAIAAGQRHSLAMK